MHFSVVFSSQKELPFWINYLTKFQLQSRKYWQWLKVKECFSLILETKNVEQTNVFQTWLSFEQKKQTQEVLIFKARKLQNELKKMEIPYSVNEKKNIPLFAGLG